ncbi:DinB family protein [Emticicia sp. BO119]|uniref:DinB family protein n=1 Tax=Emticicia sp. BO119 TaxID=2757768 RepID=UPI0015F10791|nr:DinB family protein [Emticicia sp. BO119]MBA4849086.1 DinB family protein [Emticicia sp. BO119]
MHTIHLIKLFDRDLQKLKAEIESYKDEELLWETRGEISNSAGNLCLHLMGNLNHYFGAQLGNTGYVRNRPLEFSDKNVSRTALIQKIEEAREMLKGVLENLTDEDLASNHTEEYNNGQDTNEYFLIHLYGHFNYHLGQINYHRRLIMS